MADFRSESPTVFGGVQVKSVEDYLSGTRTGANGETSEMNFDKADVLKYYLEDGSWIAARPSGTEPKIKFYIGAVADTQEEADQKVIDFEASINELIG